MKKRKGFLIFSLVFLAAIIFVVFYFKDNSDVEAIEQKQIEDAEETADELLDNLNASFEDLEETLELDSI